MADYYTFSDLKKKLTDSGNKYDLEKIERAYDYAAFLHDGQFRKSGEPYISHPLSVAEIVSELKLDTDSICASLLHDVLEDCKDKTCDDEIKRLFGQEVFELVDGLTKLPTVFFEDKEEASIENTRKLFLAMNHDIRVIFIKFADRLHNMRTLSAKSEERQRMIALETMHPLHIDSVFRRLKPSLKILLSDTLTRLVMMKSKMTLITDTVKTRTFSNSLKSLLRISSQRRELSIIFPAELKQSTASIKRCTIRERALMRYTTFMPFV